MRTTMNIEEKAFAAVASFARSKSVSLGEAASELIRLGSENLPNFKKMNGFVLFDLPAAAPPIDNAMLDALENQDLDEEYRSAMAPGR